MRLWSNTYLFIVSWNVNLIATVALSSKNVHTQLPNNKFLGFYLKEILKYENQEIFTETLLVRVKN